MKRDSACLFSSPLLLDQNSILKGWGNNCASTQCARRFINLRSHDGCSVPKSQYQPLILDIAAKGFDQPERLFQCTTQDTLTSLGVTLSTLFTVDLAKFLGQNVNF
ncbi:uncharacterized protein APUU_70793S [Aspergillus puulaauensis]|uniref:Uncharacterized protein n=1 Tax=Aspergillus puulaauensis TaxID=1220207 RepID=A0A7R7XYK7_9EURO|nr:uncharacterized protein APUU_70793S [Aspergillus puulaauensis]BCS29223.1 hypothetical protein APUU_70793S [Aspergillus puulaauensis]